MENTPDTTHQELANKIALHRSALLVVAWAIDFLAGLCAPPDTETERMELYEGLVGIVQLLAKQVNEIYEVLNKE